MKKILLSIFTICTIAAYTQAQTIPNGGLETWSTLADPETGQSEPGDFTTTERLVAGFTQAPTTTDWVSRVIAGAHGGTSAATLTTQEITGLGFIAPGMIVTGEGVSFGQGGINGGGFPVNKLPVSLKGFYKYAPQVPTDTFSVYVTLTKFDETIEQRVVIGQGFFQGTGTKTAYTEFDAPLNYMYEDETVMPDSATIIIVSTTFGADSTSIGTALTIDDLSFTGEAPVPNFSYTPTAPKTNNPIQFTNTSTGGAKDSLMWDFGDGSMPTNVENPSHTYLAKGNKDVVMALFHKGGSSTLKKSVTVSQGTAAIASNNKDAIKVGPNPANQFVQFINTMGENLNEVQVIDITGRTVMTESIRNAGDKITLNTSGLANGVYSCILKGNNNVYKSAFMINR